MKLINNSDVDISGVKVKGSAYEIKAGKSLEVPEEHGNILRDIYGFLEIATEEEKPSKEKSPKTLKKSSKKSK